MNKSKKSMGVGQALAELLRPVDFDWADMLRAEPRLAAIAAKAKAAHIAGVNWRAWEAIKRDLRPLVGWDSPNPQLASAGHWDAAVSTLLRIFEEGE